MVNPKESFSYISILSKRIFYLTKILQKINTEDESSKTILGIIEELSYNIMIETESYILQ